MGLLLLKSKFLLLSLLIISGLSGVAYGHTVDSVGEYRVEIGWMNEPVVSGETNAIEFYASPLLPCPEIEGANKMCRITRFPKWSCRFKKNTQDATSL